MALTEGEQMNFAYVSCGMSWGCAGTEDALEGQAEGGHFSLQCGPLQASARVCSFATEMQASFCLQKPPPLASTMTLSASVQSPVWWLTHDVLQPSAG